MIELLRRRWHRLRQTRFPESLPLSPVGLDEGGKTMKGLLETRPVLEKVLRENIIPWWVERTVDRDEGGFILNHGPDGAWMGPCEKFTIPQARVVWFFARAFRDGFLPEGLSLAGHGVEFLRERLWDHEHGGFFWSVSHDGSSVVDSSKRLYAQCFALYGLTEYARACRVAENGQGQETYRFARDMAEVLRYSFQDERYGGFLSELDRHMRPASPQGPRGQKVLHKTVNEHLHVLEALSAYSHLGSGEWVRQQLQDLVLILTGATFRKSGGANTDSHRADWTPLLGPGHGLTSYGHDLESVWLVAQACARLDTPFPLVADWARSAMEHTLRWGWDRKRGGVYFAGPLDGPSHTRKKVWWVQAEVLIGSLAAYRLMGDRRYADLYLDTLDWTMKRHVDWEGGEWHATVEPDGRITGDRAGIWKSPYHNGRAMMECLRLLSDTEPFCC